ncbi:MAG: hypothetical protein DLM69_01210 [Candidatus Chloroheliales bacterium]|nr:MAG: hypothetical protein DLM69_01210 [Chloroflexota bacterium]
MMPINHERYQPATSLDQLTKEEQETLALEVGLTWTEVMAVMAYSSQELIGMLTAQARIVQAVDVARKRRELSRLNAELEDMYEHRRGLDQGA